MRDGQEEPAQHEQSKRYERAAAAGGNDRACGHDGAAQEHPMVAIAPESARPMQHPPESETNRPKQVEVLRGVRVVGIRAKLSIGRLMDAWPHEKQQLARSLEPLNDSFHPKQSAVDRQQPQQAAQPGRKELCLDYPARPSSPAPRPLFGSGLSQQPIADGPKRERQPKVAPERKPGRAAVEAVGKPVDILAPVGESERFRIIGSTRV